MADGHTSKRGFARMDAEKQREIASKGGRAAHQKGTAHKFTSEEAREAGRKGGERSRGRHSAARGNQNSGEQSAVQEAAGEQVPGASRSGEPHGDQSGSTQN